MPATARPTPISRRRGLRFSRRSAWPTRHARIHAPRPGRRAADAAVELRLIDHVLEYHGDTYFDPIS